MTTQTLNDYFRSQQVPLQWSPILRALADELRANAQNDDETLKNLFRAVGYRFASEMAYRFEDAKTLVQLSEVFNDLWSETNWGVVNLEEQANHIAITHQFAPLAEAFGANNLPWSVGLLEGFYQASFSQAGAGADLQVRFLSNKNSDDENDGLHLVFQLASKR